MKSLSQESGDHAREKLIVGHLRWIRRPKRRSPLCTLLCSTDLRSHPTMITYSSWYSRDDTKVRNSPAVFVDCAILVSPATPTAIKRSFPIHPQGGYL